MADVNLQLSVVSGIAAAIEVDLSMVRLTKIGGASLSADASAGRRRLGASASVEFEVETANGAAGNSAPSVSAVVNSVSQQSASFAHHIKSAAATLGVLASVASLSVAVETAPAQATSLTLPAGFTALSTLPPTQAPTPQAPVAAALPGALGAEAGGSSVVAAAVGAGLGLLLLLFVVSKCRSKGDQGQPTKKKWRRNSKTQPEPIAVGGRRYSMEGKAGHDPTGPNVPPGFFDVSSDASPPSRLPECVTPRVSQTPMFQAPPLSPRARDKQRQLVRMKAYTRDV
jgi:hypothetical protein